MATLALRWYHRSSAELLNELEECDQSSRYSDVGRSKNLLERLVVDEIRGILWNIQLPFLDMFSKLPGEAC